MQISIRMQPSHLNGMHATIIRRMLKQFVNHMIMLIRFFHTLQAGSQSLEIDASSSQYVDVDLYLFPLSNYLCMTNPSATNCPNGFTLNVYLNIESIVDNKGIITTRAHDGAYKSGIQVRGAPDTLRLRYQNFCYLLLMTMGCYSGKCKGA